MGQSQAKTLVLPLKVSSPNLLLSFPIGARSNTGSSNRFKGSAGPLCVQKWAELLRAHAQQ
jgi:hypothetical protein